MTVAFTVVVSAMRTHNVAVSLSQVIHHLTTVYAEFCSRHPLVDDVCLLGTHQAFLDTT